MKDILKRYLRITFFIVSAFFVLNMVIADRVLNYTDRDDPEAAISLLDSIHISGEQCRVSKPGITFIRNHTRWAMILGEDGRTIFKYNLPEECDRKYSAGEIADFSNWYLDGYPVTTLNAPGGVVVMASERGTVWKRHIAADKSTLGILIASLFLINIITALILSWTLSKLFMRDISKVINGIVDLSNGKSVHLPEQGYLKNVHKAVNSVSEDMDQKSEIIKHNNDMKKSWLTGVTHDIMTPLSVIAGRAEEISEKDKRASLITIQVFKIKSLLEDLNLISRLENYKQYELSESADLAKILRECFADMINTCTSDKYRFQFENHTCRKIMLKADDHLLKRAFSNIISNSVVHNPEGCVITVILDYRDGQAQIIFEDNGSGADAETVDRLNKSDVTDNESVHGWGTVVARQVIELYGGSIAYSSNMQGMMVVITLPIKS